MSYFLKFDAFAAISGRKTKQRQSCFQAHDNTSVYLQKAEGSITDGQNDGGSVQCGVQGLHIFLCGGEKVLLGVTVSRVRACSSAASKTSAIRHHAENDRLQHPPLTRPYSRNECPQLWQRIVFRVTPFRVGKKHC